MKRLPLMRLLLSLLLLCHCSISLLAGNRIYAPEIKTLQAVVNDDWLSPAVMRLNSDDWLQVSFDELSHDDHRYIYRLQHCEVDWTPSDDLFETDWLEGFNDVVIDDFERALADTHTDDPAAIKEGMDLIFKKFVKTLEGLGVKKIDTDDKDFDVDYHEAIAMVPGMGDDKKGKVIDCVQTGYMLNDKVIRHAKVAVGQ